MTEAFVKTFKRDYAYVADLRSAQHVLEQLLGWFSKTTNNKAPHKELKMLSQKEYYWSSQEDLKK